MKIISKHKKGRTTISFWAVFTALCLISLFLATHAAAKPIEALSKNPSEKQSTHPGQGVCINPDHSTETNPVTFTWQADPAATRYHLWIDHPTGIEWEDWIDAEDASCTSETNTCSFTPQIQIEPGDYVWWILPATANTYGQWSEALPFKIGDSPKASDDIEILSPVGKIITDTPAWPVIKWQHIKNATMYTLNLSGPGLGNGIKFEVFPTTSTMPGDSLAQSLETLENTILFDMAYQLTIIAKVQNVSENEPADQNHSSLKTQVVFSFAHTTNALPQSVTPINPIDTTESNGITLVWEGDPLATKYWLWIESRTNSTVWDLWVSAAEASCLDPSTPCSYKISESFENGAYQWWVLAANETGLGTWSDPISFHFIETPDGSAQKPSPGTGLQPDGTDEKNPITLIWEADPAAIKYKLWIDNETGKEWNHHNVTPEDAQCQSGDRTCSFTLPVHLTSGEKTWWVLPIGQGETATAWSSPLSFTVLDIPTGGQKPGQGLGIAPDNAVEDNPLTLIWQADPNATKYLIWIENNQAVLVWESWIMAAEAQCQDSTSTCQYHLKLRLPAGAFTWWVTPANEYNSGKLSAPLNFIIQ